jgi:hypothetical protein
VVDVKVAETNKLIELADKKGDLIKSVIYITKLVKKMNSPKRKHKINKKKRETGKSESLHKAMIMKNLSQI